MKSMPWSDDKYISRFWSRVNILSPEECWEWTRGKTSDGYGVFHFGNHSIRSHRFSYQLHFGEITEHECVCHSCDNPSCVNPAHLWIGTRAENNADKEAKGRAVHFDQKLGEQNSFAKLSDIDVITIKNMASKGFPQARLAKLFGISTSLVCMIVNQTRHQINLEIVMKQRDQMAEALEGMLQIYGGALDHDYLPKSSVEMDCIDQARAALAAVKGE